MVFVSVIRVVALWFGQRQSPLITQPPASWGRWAPSRPRSPWPPRSRRRVDPDLPRRGPHGGRPGDRRAAGHARRPRRGAPTRAVPEPLRTLRTTWDSPGTRLGLWSHFTSQFGMTVFTLLWGFPFLVRGQGLSETTAGSAAGAHDRHPDPRRTGARGIRRPPPLPAVPPRAARRRRHRHGVGRGPDLARSLPLPLLVVLVVLTALGGPASMVGFDLARSFNPRERIGSALGVVNVGGFVASLSAMALVGIVLDQVTPGGPTAYTLDGFRLAMAVQFPFWALGSAADLAVPAQGDPPPARSPSRGATGAPRRRVCLSGHLPLAADGGPGALPVVGRGGTFGGVRRRAPRSCPSGDSTTEAPEATGGATSEAWTAYGYQPVATQIGPARSREGCHNRCRGRRRMGPPLRRQ